MNLLPLIEKLSPEKSGSFAIADTRGVSKSFTIAPTNPANAAPITTPTARSTTFPRNKNALNPRMISSQNSASVPQADRRRAHPAPVYVTGLRLASTSPTFATVHPGQENWSFVGQNQRSVSKNACHHERSEGSVFSIAPPSHT